jgi:hypothetical protein
MKQSELDKLVNSLLKYEAKEIGWKSIGGQVYWLSDYLFFSLLVSTVARDKSMYYRLNFKWFSLDDRLWEILGMPENKKAPVSLRANGAFTIYGQEILSGIISECEWSESWIVASIKEIFSSAGSTASQISNKIVDIDKYLEFLEKAHAELMIRSPMAALNVWKEALLVALEKGDVAAAARIAEARIAAKDSGSFSSHGKTFYECALCYLAQ